MIVQKISSITFTSTLDPVSQLVYFVNLVKKQNIKLNGLLNGVYGVELKRKYYFIVNLWFIYGNQHTKYG